MHHEPGREVAEVHRRRFWLFVLGLATAGTYVAFRDRSRRTETLAPRGRSAPESGGASRAGEAASALTALQPADEAEAPTGPVATVDVTMAAPSDILVANGDGGRSAVEAPPATHVPRPLPPLRPLELPPQRRPSGATLAALATVAGIAAVLLGGWAFLTSARDEAGPQAASPAEAVRLLSRPGVERLPLRGSVGRIVLAVEGEDAGSLVLNGLGPAPDGMAYQMWVTAPGAARPTGAGLFSGTERVVSLERPVAPGATVAVTLEPAGGSPAPSRALKLVVTRPS